MQHKHPEDQEAEQAKQEAGKPVVVVPEVELVKVDKEALQGRHVEQTREAKPGKLTRRYTEAPANTNLLTTEQGHVPAVDVLVKVQELRLIQVGHSKRLGANKKSYRGRWLFLFANY